MRREHASTSPRRILALALSIAAPSILVNANAEGLSSVNQKVLKEHRADFARLIDTIFKNGKDGKFGPNLAPIVGLPTAMPTKDAEKILSQSKDSVEKKGCYIVIDEKEPSCAYIVNYRVSGKDSATQYFRVSLDGRLEKAVLTQGKRDENGKSIKGSGVKFDQDIESPEVQKAFNSEMAYWLKDWLKKEKKAADKKAEVTKPIKTAAL